MGDEAALTRARSMALAILDRFSQPTQDDLTRAIDAAVHVEESMDGSAVDKEKLFRLLESEVSVYVGPAAVLQDSDEAHTPWLDSRRNEIEWNFRDNYLQFIKKNHPPEVVRNTNRMTDEILDLLEDPLKEGSWDRRGMVVGEVQSGKTSNYTGLICKAADAGYKFIVVLAGVHNSLRSQTQHRLDEGFLGFESEATLNRGVRKKIGVGLGGRKPPAAITLTSSAEDGDFHRNRAQNFAARIGGDPFLLVVKKNTRVLENLIQWIASVHGEEQPGSTDRIIHDLPILVIDDEADHASVNTNREGTTLDGDEIETDPTAVNRQIRRLLKSFSRSSFVSYTATPFANIFIRSEKPDSKHGEDLFPRSFILRMKAPSNHTGPGELFGITSSQRDAEAIEGLPVVRTIADQDVWLEPKHKKTAKPGPLPESLKRAVDSFILTIAARRVRGQADVHNSMLIHVTRFIDVQSKVAGQILDLVDALAECLEGFAGKREKQECLERLRGLWEDDFAPTSSVMGIQDPDPWSLIEGELPAVARRIKVLEINGTQRDTLVYNSSSPACVIAVGGDKLSRGLTLEGLTVSYYLRASRMYDTLMQMGRWFGYRPNYLDLTRLYTSAEIQSAFRQIAIANEELKEKFDEMASIGSNPRDFALYVRKSDNLLITAPGKMRNNMQLELGFAGKIVETIGFAGSESTQLSNLDAVRFLVERNLDREQKLETKRLVLRPVSGEHIYEFLLSFSTVEGATKARSRQLAEYVKIQIGRNELTTWTVALVSNSQAKAGHTIKMAGRDLGLTHRQDEAVDAGEGSVSALIEGQYSIKRLVNPPDELIDLDDGELRAAEAARKRTQDIQWAQAKAIGADPLKQKKLSLAPFARRIRPAERGMLIIYMLDPEGTWMEGKLEAVPGFAISFPESETAESVRYAVPTRYREMIG